MKYRLYRLKRVTVWEFKHLRDFNASLKILLPDRDTRARLKRMGKADGQDQIDRMRNIERTDTFTLE